MDIQTQCLHYHRLLVHARDLLLYILCRCILISHTTLGTWYSFPCCSIDLTIDYPIRNKCFLLYVSIFASAQSIPLDVCIYKMMTSPQSQSWPIFQTPPKNNLHWCLTFLHHHLPQTKVYFLLVVKIAWVLQTGFQLVKTQETRKRYLFDWKLFSWASKHYYICLW